MNYAYLIYEKCKSLYLVFVGKKKFEKHYFWQ